MIVVADTSILINLCRVGQGGLLRALFHEVIIPPQVAIEFTRLTASVSRFNGLTLPSGIRQQQPVLMVDAVRDAIGLDVGEASALSLAVEVHADAILVDERRGRDVAVALGLRTIGILGILLQAKAGGYFRRLNPCWIRATRCGFLDFRFTS